MRLLVTSEFYKFRLDKYLSLKLPFISRNKLKILIKTGKIKLNNRIKTPATLVYPEDIVEIEEINELLSQKIEIKPCYMNIEVIYQDDDIIVVNKPPNIIMHPTYKCRENTLLNAILSITHLAEEGGPLRPGVVHRLDKGTSGVVILAKNNYAYFDLRRQFASHQVYKEYLAIVKNIPKTEEGEIEIPIGRSYKGGISMRLKGKNPRYAKTIYKIEEVLEKGYCLLLVSPKTGRTHQIRVHLAKALRLPIVGDKEYGIKSDYINRPALHAKKICFIHPTQKKQVSFDAELPSDFKYCLNKLKNL